MNRAAQAATRDSASPFRFDGRRRGSIWALLAFLGASLTGFSLTACQGDSEADTEAAPGAGDASAPAANADFERQRTLVMELDKLNGALAPLLQQAQLDPGIKAKEETLSKQIDEAMEATSPGTLDAIARFEAAQSEHAAAQLAGEQERVAELQTELQGLQTQIQETQRLVQSQEAVAASIADFRADLAAWMRATDPGADSLLTRIDAIVEELNASLAASNGG